jgi:hypothetical protein
VERVNATLTKRIFCTCAVFQGRRLAFIGQVDISRSGVGVGAGFLLRILWCSQSGDHNENNLAKFDYILNMKVRKSQNSFIFLAIYWNLLKKSDDVELLFFEIW